MAQRTLIAGNNTGRTTKFLKEVLALAIYKPRKTIQIAHPTKLRVDICFDLFKELAGAYVVEVGKDPVPFVLLRNDTKVFFTVGIEGVVDERSGLREGAQENH